MNEDNIVAVGIYYNYPKKKIKSKLPCLNSQFTCCILFAAPLPFLFAHRGSIRVGIAGI